MPRYNFQHHKNIPKEDPIGTKKNKDIKKSLDFLSDKVTAVRVWQRQILDFLVENGEKDRHIADLERSINNVMIKGLQTAQLCVRCSPRQISWATGG